VALVGCGDPAKLDADEVRDLAVARERLDEALDTEEALRTSRSEARRLARQVRGAGDSPSRLRALAPSLVDRGTVDRQALRAFLLYADSDAPRALHGPATRQVNTIASTLEDKDRETEIPGRPRLTAERYLSDVERDVKPIWPDLADKLQETRGRLWSRLINL
jgi:hypothetical protein